MLAASTNACQEKLMSAIKQLRKRLGWSQQRLADAIGMSLASVRNYEAGAVPSAEALAKLRALSPTDFEPLFAKASDNKRMEVNEQWHRMLESILNSNREDVIDALKSSLVVFNRVVVEQPRQTIPEPKPSRKGQTGGNPPGARRRPKNT
jgi:transcriptional regulator with XRE-family HTH domain